MKEIDGAELACISNMECDTCYRLFRKEGRIWVRVWIHFRPTINGLKPASNHDIEASQFGNVIVFRNETLKSLVDAKLNEIDLNLDTGSVRSFTADFDVPKPDENRSPYGFTLWPRKSE